MSGGMPDEQARQAADQRSEVGPGDRQRRSRSENLQGARSGHLDVRAIRTKLKMSQNAFAARFGILPSTLRDWEQNRRHPDGAARVLLMVIDKEPDAVTRALATASRQKHIQKSAASALRTPDYFTARAARADIPKALKVLKRAGVGKPPTKGDELPPRKKRAKRQASL